MWLNAGKVHRKKFFLTKMNSFTVCFKDFDHKLLDLFLISHKDFLHLKVFQWLRLLPFQFVIYLVSIFWNNIFIYNNKDGSRSPTISKMRFFGTFVNSWNPLSNVTKSSILDVAGALDILRNNVQKQPWWVIPRFTCTLLFLVKKCVLEVENFKLVCLEQPWLY